MKTVVCTKFGPPEVLQLKEAPRPHPGPHEILVKVKVVTVTAGGCYVEYKCLPEDGLVVLKPDNLSFAEAAAILAPR